MTDFQQFIELAACVLTGVIGWSIGRATRRLVTEDTGDSEVDEPVPPGAYSPYREPAEHEPAEHESEEQDKDEDDDDDDGEKAIGQCGIDTCVGRTDPRCGARSCAKCCSLYCREKCR